MAQLGKSTADLQEPKKKKLLTQKIVLLSFLSSPLKGCGDGDEMVNDVMMASIF